MFLMISANSLDLDLGNKELKFKYLNFKLSTRF